MHRDCRLGVWLENRHILNDQGATKLITGRKGHCPNLTNCMSVTQISSLLEDGALITLLK